MMHISGVYLPPGMSELNVTGAKPVQIHTNRIQSISEIFGRNFNFNFKMIITS